MMNLLKQWWANHGTKIIGFGSMLIGAVSAIDQATIHVIQDTFGALYAHIILIVSGISVAWRGFTNSQKTPPVTPPTQ